MSYTSAERIARVRHYLGYADRFRDFESQRQVEQALAAISAESLAIVDELLDDLISLDAEKRSPTGARLRIKAVKVGPIELPGGTEIMLLRSLGKEGVGRLGSLLGIPVAHDVFSSSAHFVGQSGFAGGDNYFPHG